jgi:O-antigen biosynthesis protein
VLGKSLYLGSRQLHVRGVTYGTFAGDDDQNFPRRDAVVRDFEAIAAAGGNAVRTYSVPPVWLLDVAHDVGLHVLVGLPWEEHVAFLDDRGRSRSIPDRVGEGVQACSGHPAVLAYAVGNEIPASIVRWLGRRRVERFLGLLCERVKQEDPGALATYVNYPSTEYLQLPFVDLVCFNVFLESGSDFKAYVARLQNIAGDRPLLITELGLDSRRHGLQRQAETVEGQVRSAFSAGSAGVFVFSWTDEWHRGGVPVENWDFGLVDRARNPKPALATVQKAFAEVPFSPDGAWPKISVIVCVYNGEKTLRACLEGVSGLQYPDFEVIVVDDGSSDSTAEIASEFGFRVITTSNAGLAAARNVGLSAANGEIVAYLDADAWPDPHWLMYLADGFQKGPHCGIGGPNIPPPRDGIVGDAVAQAPGGPIHVLLTDEEAEHIPGCNMALRKACLDDVGGFDPTFRIAGDDVDVCWRLQAHGWTLGFSPGASVWHHRRPTVRAYLRQQYEYGKAEALLERKWPQKYNDGGHLTWRGRVYSDGRVKLGRSRRWRVYYGVWGSEGFQSAHEESAGLVATMPLLPEWYLLLLALAALAALGAVWRPLLLALPLFLLAVGTTAADCLRVALRAKFPGRNRAERILLRALTTSLCMLQPAARLFGRLRGGLTPWRKRGRSGLALPTAQTTTLWSDRWLAPAERIRAIEQRARSLGAAVLSGSVYDRWDLEVRTTIGGVSRVRIAVEEHGHGRQLVRVRFWPKPSRSLVVLAVALVILAGFAALDNSAIATGVLVGTAFVLVGIVTRGCAAATGTVSRAVSESGAGSEEFVTLLRRRASLVGATVQTRSRNGGVSSSPRAEHLAGARREDVGSA